MPGHRVGLFYDTSLIPISSLGICRGFFVFGSLISNLSEPLIVTFSEGLIRTYFIVLLPSALPVTLRAFYFPEFQ